MIMIELTGNFDNMCELAAKQIEKFAEDNQPKITVMNDGIGPYEFWGARGFDRGTNYAEIEETGPYQFAFNLSDLTAEEIEDFLTGFDGEYHGHINNTIETERGNDVYVDVRFITHNGGKCGDVYTVLGKWVDMLE